jgi:hypothetical protein
MLEGIHILYMKPLYLVVYLTYTGKSRYVELGYVEYPGCVEPSARFGPYLLYNMIYKTHDISNMDISNSPVISNNYLVPSTIFTWVMSNSYQFSGLPNINVPKVIFFLARLIDSDLISWYLGVNCSCKLSFMRR